MKNKIIILLQTLILIAVPVIGSAQYGNSATKTPSADPCRAIDPDLDKLLDKIEKPGIQPKSLQAEMSFQQIQTLIAIKELRRGRE